MLRWPFVSCSENRNIDTIHTSALQRSGVYDDRTEAFASAAWFSLKPPPSERQYRILKRHDGWVAYLPDFRFPLTDKAAVTITNHLLSKTFEPRHQLVTRD